MCNESHGSTLDELRARRDEILRVSAARGAHNVRVFGSVARGEGHSGSDLDFVVELEADRTVLDLSELILDLEDALGRPVDIVEVRRDLPIAGRILRDAVPL